MANGRLSAYVLPAFNSPVFDHTYVESSIGRAYRCHGRSSGGTRLVVGSGNVDTAHCLATPSGDAAIEYGITGVCHQAANRILQPAGVTVDAARGYRGSCFVWGTYGAGPWVELANCNASHTHP